MVRAGGEIPGLLCPACDGTGTREALAAHVHGPQPEAHDWRPVPQRCADCRGMGAQLCAVCGDLPAVTLDTDLATGEERPVCPPCWSDAADADVDAAASVLSDYVGRTGWPGEAVPVELRAAVRRLVSAVARQRRFTGHR